MERLYEVFLGIVRRGSDGATIAPAEFHQAVQHGLKSNVLIDRVFALFDANRDGVLSFPEFVMGLSVFTRRATSAEKARFSFRIFDFGGNGYVDLPGLRALLETVLAESGYKVDARAITHILEETFEELGAEVPGRVSLAEYEALVRAKPHLVEFMTIRDMEKFLFGTYSSELPHLAPDAARVMRRSPPHDNRSVAPRAASPLGSPNNSPPSSSPSMRRRPEVPLKGSPITSMRSRASE